MEKKNNRYLIHYGVKGMKWGVRKEEIRSKRASWSQIRRMVENDHKMLIKSANKHSNQIKKLKLSEHSQLDKTNSEADRKRIQNTFYNRRVEIGKSFINDVNKTSVDPHKDFYSNEFRNSLSKKGKDYFDDLLIVSIDHIQYEKIKK